MSVGSGSAVRPVGFAQPIPTKYLSTSYSDIPPVIPWSLVSQNPAEDRRRRAAGTMRESSRRESRRRWLTIAGVGVLSLAVVGLFVVLSVRGASTSDEGSSEGEAADLTAVETYDGLTRNHVLGTVAYPQTPPVGGDHNQVWMDCGSYDSPVPNEMAVHSLEHGAVWITYQPELPASDVATVTAISDRNNFVLVSPAEGLGSPVVASAWGKQLALPGVDDARLDAFVTEFAQGPQTPEIGAPCTGGSAGMESP